MTREQEQQLELLIDASSLAEVLTSIAQIMREKAEHCIANWQDGITGGALNAAAAEVDECADSLAVVLVSKDG